MNDKTILYIGFNPDAGEQDYFDFVLKFAQRDGPRSEIIKECPFLSFADARNDSCDDTDESKVYEEIYSSATKSATNKTSSDECKKWKALLARNYGSFLKIEVCRKTKPKVSCVCEKYNRCIGCYESKFFGFILADMDPTADECGMRAPGKTIADERKVVREEFLKSYDVSSYASAAEKLMDPQKVQYEQCNVNTNEPILNYASETNQMQPLRDTMSTNWPIPPSNQIQPQFINQLWQYQYNQMQLQQIQVQQQQQLFQSMYPMNFPDMSRNDEENDDK